jgi:hypothetical protein
MAETKQKRKPRATEAPEIKAAVARKKEKTPSVEKSLQGHLPGTAPEKNVRVHKAAVTYYDLMLVRKAAGEEEVAAKETLLTVMAEENVESYEFNGLHVRIDLKKTPKVKIDAKEKDDKPKE